MSRIYVCNSYSDSLSEIDCESFEELRRIKLSTLKERIGPHGICQYKDNIITANKYSNDISILNLNDCQMSNCIMGNSCSDVKVVRDMAYISCSDSNDIKAFDLIDRKIEFRIACGNCPKNICVNENSHILAVNNFMDNSISIIDYLDYENKNDIVVGGYPSKVAYCECLDVYVVLVSLIGKNKNGYLRIIDGDLNYIGDVELGKTPLDVCVGHEKAYISNFQDGTISIVDLNTLTEVRNIKISGMPRGVLVRNNELFVADYYGNYLYKVDLNSFEKKKINIGNEPVSMIII